MNSVKTAISVVAIILIALSESAMAAGKGSDAYFVKVDRETTTQNNEQKNPDKKIAPGKEKRPGLPAGKRQHKPLTVTKSTDKASPNKSGATKKVPRPHRVGDVTLKRGVIESK